MKNFDTSDVLSVTTGRLVSSRHIDGVYEILNFLTGDNLYTHQLPRAMRECEPWLRTQFPQLMRDSPGMVTMLNCLNGMIAVDSGTLEAREKTIAEWVADVKKKFSLPDTLSVYEMGADMHTHIDPVEEAQAMVGDKRVIALDLGRKV